MTQIKINDSDQKTPDAKKNGYNVKLSEIEAKIPSISDLGATAALFTVKIKIPSVSNLATKTNYDAKTLNIESKYITTSEYDKFTA